MLKIYIKNETDASYDSIRRAAKASFRDSAAYRMRQVTFDDQFKPDGILGICIGDIKAIDIQMDVVLHNITELTRVARPFRSDDPKDEKVAETSKGPVDVITQ